MDGRQRPRRGARGGEGIQTLRQARARLILAALSVASYLGVLVWSCALSPRFTPVLLFLGGCGLALLLLVVVRGLEDLLGTSIMLLGVCYVVGLLVGRHVLDEAAPLAGAGLLLSAELTTWSLEERVRVRAPRRFWFARASAVAVLVLGGLLASSLVLAAAATPFGGGLAWTVAGAAAAVLAVAVGARLVLTR